jgi:hypothetical protein
MSRMLCLCVVPTSMENLIFDYFCNFEMLPKTILWNLCKFIYQGVRGQSSLKRHFLSSFFMPRQDIALNPLIEKLKKLRATLTLIAKMWLLWWDDK